MSTGRTKAQTVQVTIFSTQTEPRKKVHISQLFWKFHMLSFPVSVNKEFLLSHSSWNFTCVLFSRLGKRLWIDISIYGSIYIYIFPFKQAEPRKFSTSHRSFWNFKWAFFTILFTQKKINENKAREQGGINLIVSVQTRKTQGISTPLRILIFSP